MKSKHITFFDPSDISFNKSRELEKTKENTLVNGSISDLNDCKYNMQIKPIIDAPFDYEDIIKIKHRVKNNLEIMKVIDFKSLHNPIKDEDIYESLLMPPIPRQLTNEFDSKGRVHKKCQKSLRPFPKSSQLFEKFNSKLYSKQNSLVLPEDIIITEQSNMIFESISEPICAKSVINTPVQTEVFTFTSPVLCGRNDLIVTNEDLTNEHYFYFFSKPIFISDRKFQPCELVDENFVFSL